ncbi:MAG: TetR/AcrR family transcriptional regulator [Clostridium sp.]|nr:TetR/AcrR family transcriptional regulator [Clostridium sp.]
MYKAFENIPIEKKEKIIQASLEEFASNGYENASTNKIVEKAGISKGLLFHYFKNKEGLFIYLYDYYYPIFFKQLMEFNESNNNTDIFEKLKLLTLVKFDLINEYPLATEFFKKFPTAPRHLIEKISKKYESESAVGFSKLYSNIDYSKFKDNVDVSKCLKVLTWTLEAYGEDYIMNNVDSSGGIILDKEKLLKDLDEYLDILRNGFYK